MKASIRFCFLAGLLGLFQRYTLPDAHGQIVNKGQTIVIGAGTVLVADDVQNVSGGIIQNAGEVTTRQVDNQLGTIGITGSWLVTDSFSNLSFIQNSGTIQVKGNWTNDSQASYQGVGTVHLTGTEQTVNHGDQRIGTLIIDNTTTYLQSNLLVLGTLHLKKGWVVIPDTAQGIRMEKATSTLKGGSDNSYVDGTFYWTGTQERVYPLGKNKTYTPVTLSSETYSGADPLIVGMRLYEPASAPVKPDTSINRLFGIRYWEQIVRSGSSQAYVTLPIMGDEGIVSMDSVVVAGTDSLKHPFSSLGRGFATGSIDRGTVSSKRHAKARFLTLAEPIRGELLYVPNAFAPESLHPEERVCKVYGTTLSPTGIQLDIYNRWGTLIYSSRSLEEIAGQGWSGQNQQTHQPETSGVYTYVLQGKFTTGKPFRRTGTITLIR